MKPISRVVNKLLFPGLLILATFLLPQFTLAEDDTLARGRGFGGGRHEQIHRSPHEQHHRTPMQEHHRAPAKNLHRDDLNNYYGDEPVYVDDSDDNGDSDDDETEDEKEQEELWEEDDG